MKCSHLLALYGIFLISPPVLHSQNETPKTYQQLLQEQRFDESIAVFLNHLNNQKKSDNFVPESTEFEEAYLIYLNLQGKPSQEIATELIVKYGPTTQDPHLAYLLAASYANLGRFDLFFPLFTAGYLNNPDHYLADKMIAVLHIKLYERLLPGNQKEEERAYIIGSLQKALAKNRSDHMLYKMLLAFSSDSDRSKNVELALNTMISEKVNYPRADLLFYVKIALAAGNKTLAQKFVDYSRTLFGYSRSLEAAQRILDSKES